MTTSFSTISDSWLTIWVGYIVSSIWVIMENFGFDLWSISVSRSPNEVNNVAYMIWLLQLQFRFSLFLLAIIKETNNFSSLFYIFKIVTQLSYLFVFIKQNLFLLKNYQILIPMSYKYSYKFLSMTKILIAFLLLFLSVFTCDFNPNSLPLI